MPTRPRRYSPQRHDDQVAATRTMTRMLRRRIVVRVLVLLLAGVSIYLLLPSLLEIFSSWPQLKLMWSSTMLDSPPSAP